MAVDFRSLTRTAAPAPGAGCTARCGPWVVHRVVTMQAMWTDTDTSPDTALAVVAARLIVDEGLDYGAAKRRAVQQLGLPVRTRLPDNDTIEAAVREHIALFCADTQPNELRVLRELALVWMARLPSFRPHLGGAVWHGTATRLSDVFVQLFCDDAKSAELALINQNVAYEAGRTTGFRGAEVDVLSIHAPCPSLRVSVGVHLLVYDADDVRGAFKPDAQGRKPRGDAAAVRALLAKSADAAPAADATLSGPVR